MTKCPEKSQGGQVCVYEVEDHQVCFVDKKLWLTHSDGGCLGWFTRA